jgi:hypothetical protein
MAGRKIHGIVMREVGDDPKKLFTHFPPVGLVKTSRIGLETLRVTVRV